MTFWGRVGLDPEHVRPLPAAAGGAVMGGEDMDDPFPFKSRSF